MEERLVEQRCLVYGGQKLEERNSVRTNGMKEGLDRDTPHPGHTF